ncbi:MAG: sigma-54-dependent Fis family transcriptional regulator, partial [Chlorobiaceae bacterium]|nr:sigma-54-dependent Fis family transcriptional regulator [Chlorobiaceae bacterium]
MCFTLLIASSEKKVLSRRTPQEGRQDLRIFFACSIAEAEKIFRNENIDLVLFSLDSGDPGLFGRIAGSAKQKKGTKIVVFGTLDELSDTLNSFEKHTPEELKRLFSPGYSRAPIPECMKGRNDDFLYHGLIGNSCETRKVKDLVVRIAPTNTTVLIQGESGTGKEVIARAIHYQSTRQNEVFMPVDCAAINESVIESELFGHTKGAFTGADWSTLGLIRSADRGTLFLDEIAELPLHLQAKLLRTLQEKSVKPVGTSKIFPVDIRIVSATNRNLAEEVKKGTFRQDLYYRLSTVTIYSPPLRERLSDLPLLCAHFLKQLRQEGFPEKKL